MYARGSNLTYLLLYVDNIILTASSASVLRSFIAALSTEFDMKDLGPLHHFLGLTVTVNNDGLFLSQSQYAADIIRCGNISAYNPCSTPTDTKGKLLAASGPPVPDPNLYCSLAGAL